MQTKKFSEMNLSSEILRAVEEIGFEEATNIQAESIPLIMSGKDVIGHSQTGTGKTAAFSIPAIETINVEQGKKPQVIILCPTRELAIQACDEIKKLTKYKKGIKAVPIYGGQQIDRQFVSLRSGAQIIVGTPGRVIDHIRRRTLKLDEVKMVILDEADEMLSMGFREDIETILKEVPEERQIILFSATMSAAIMKLTKQYQNDPELIKIAYEQLTVPSIDQYYYEVPSDKKVEVLSRLVDVYHPSLSMVFCNTKKQVDELVSELQLRGYMADGLHGDMRQQQRTHTMDLFKKGHTDILVATDVAARGIDVDDIEAVFNYDIPQDVEYYVHRIGRTGRAGKEGKAFTFVTGRREVMELRNIMNFTKSKIELKRIPSSDEMIQSKSRKFYHEVKKVIDAGGLDELHSILDMFMEENYTSVDVATALIKMMMLKNGSDIEKIRADDAAFAALSKKQISAVSAAGRDQRGRGQRNTRSQGPSRQGVQNRVRKTGGYRDDRNMEQVVINIGREKRVAPAHILGAIAGETGLPGKTFGKIEISDKYTVVGVPKEHLETVLRTMPGCKIMGHKTNTTIANKKY